jgi:hypothetical protein
MQQPVTVSRTCGNDARQSRSSSSPRQPDPGGAREPEAAEIADARRGGDRRAHAREAPPAREREAQARDEPLVAVRRLGLHQRAPDELRAPAREQVEPHAREVGLGRCHERERCRELRVQERRHAARHAGEQGLRHRSPHHDLGDAERCCERRARARRRRELQHARDVERLALQQQAEVEPLHERQHEPVLERRVERELQQQVLDRRPGR